MPLSRVTFEGYIDVGNGCWRPKVLVTESFDRQLWRFRPSHRVRGHAVRLYCFVDVKLVLIIKDLLTIDHNLDNPFTIIRLRHYFDIYTEFYD